MPFDITHCAACGVKIELYGDHHCDPKFERQREGIDRREQEWYERPPSWATRLNVGFSLLRLAGDL